MKALFLAMALVTSKVAACGGDYATINEPEQRPPFVSLDALQAEFLKRFLDAPGFGMSRVILPEFHRPASQLLLSGRKFEVKAPELIGLEEHAAPVAYQLPMGSFAKADLTNKVMKSSVKLRELNDFESRALARLRSGENVVMELDSAAKQSPQAKNAMRLKAMGAIRATKDCLDCHSGKEGKLLGAFSYVLTRIEPGPKKSAANAGSAKLAAEAARPLR